MNTMNRRHFLRNCAFSATFVASGALVSCSSTAPRKGAREAAGPKMSLNKGWLFGGKFAEGADKAGFDDSSFSQIVLPHSVTKLSWHKWDPATWENTWIYRRHFSLAEASRKGRVFLDFERVMAGARPSINDRALPEHLGGYLPFHYEITEWLKDGDNVLAVVVDSRWQNVPPEGNPKGPSSVDYLEPGGIPGSVSLRVILPVFIRIEHFDWLGKNIADEHRRHDAQTDCPGNSAGLKIIDRGRPFWISFRRHVLPARINDHRQHIIPVLEPLSDFVMERQVTAEVFRQSAVVYAWSCSCHDAFEIEKHTAFPGCLSQGEMPPVNPSIFPRCRVPLVPGKFGDGMRQDNL